MRPVPNEMKDKTTESTRNTLITHKIFKICSEQIMLKP